MKIIAIVGIALLVIISTRFEKWLKKKDLTDKQKGAIILIEYGVLFVITYVLAYLAFSS